MMKIKLKVIEKNNPRFWEKCFKKPKYDYKKLVDRDWSNLKSRLKKYRVKRILDLGCGYGQWSIVLARAGFKVKAIDFTKAAIKILKKWAVEENLLIDAEVCAAQKFMAKAKFGAVICNSVLDHMTFNDAKIVANNIKNILKPGGIAYLSFDGPGKNTKDFITLDDGTRCYIKGEFKKMLWRYYTEKEIKNLFKGLEILEFSKRRNGKRDVWVKKRCGIRIN